MSDIKSTTLSTSSIIASVDLGSNSFHMLVARVDSDGSLVVVDSSKEMVRLRGGLNNSGELDHKVESRALACLERFGERLQHLPTDAVRVAGTNTLRTMHRADDFLQKGQQALGHRIDIISGEEEARLIYLGVSHSLSHEDITQLVIDIGGGSTEFILGKQFIPLNVKSLNIGSVSMSQRYFSKGLNKSYWKKANTELKLEILPLMHTFNASC